jgi:serine/threonine protein kinase
VDSKRYLQIRALFDAALQHPADEQERIVMNAANGDRELREEVLKLLRASDRGSDIFESRPLVDLSCTSHVGRGSEGRRLGPYELVREIGEGGMGVVYLAKRADGAFEKQVAIKIVRQELATPQFLARFQREREILAKLEHPYIARLLDGGFAPEPYFVMEYVEGQSLLTWADSRQLSFDKRLRLLRQVAEAVDYAHEKGVVHRDLKPSNIFVDATGQVKLLDFGIAAWQQPDQQVNETEVAPTVALSPAYASPEQARGEKTGKATDIYSFAMVAYELLAGVLPFRYRNQTLESVLRMIADEIPAAPSEAVRLSTDPEPAVLGRMRSMGPADLVLRLEQTVNMPILKALSKVQAERPASANELVDALTSSGSRHQPWHVRVGTALRRESAILAALASFASLLALGEISLSKFGWVFIVISTILLCLWRVGVLTRTEPVLAAALLFVLSISWDLTHSSTMAGVSGKSVLGAVAASICGILAVRHLFRESRLGPIIAESRTTWQSWVRIPLMVLLVWDLSDSKTLPGIAFHAIVVLAAILWSFAKFEVRQKGVCLGLESRTWAEIESFALLSNSKLAIILREPFWASHDSRVNLAPQDLQRIRKVLRNHLIESTPVWSAAQDSVSEE